MTQTIDHQKREELGISSMAWLVIDAYWQGRDRPADKEYVQTVTGLSPGQITSCLKELSSSSLFVSETGEFGVGWTSLFDPYNKVESAGLVKLCEDLVEHINMRTGRSFRNSKSLQDGVRRLMRALPSEHTTFKRLTAIVDYGWESWTPAFREKVTPKLFIRTPDDHLRRSENAREYWATKNKGK